MIKPNNDLVIELVISPYDYLCPLILQKDKQIVFKITGKWSINTNAKDLDYRGNIDSLETLNGFPIGVLMGRNSSCPEEGYFKIYNGLRYTAKKNGVLFVCFNYDWYSKMEPQGQPSLSISLSSFVDQDTLYKNMGLELVYLSDNMILKYINMARVKPKEFTDIYLGHLINSNSTIAALYHEMKEMNQLTLLKENAFLSKLSFEMSSDLGKSGRVSHYDSEKRNIIKRAKAIHQELSGVKNINECYMDIKEAYTTFQSPISSLFVVLKLLIDELIPSRENRKCLLNDKIQYCGISIAKHISYDNICVINFSENEY